MNVQTAKTRFMSGEEARSEFLGVTPLIDTIRREYVEAQEFELEQLAFSAEYMSVADLIRESAEHGIPPEVLWRAYDEFVRGRVGKDFKKGMFHYLLGQLGRIHDRFAVEDVLQRLVDQPQETENILQYLAHVRVEPAEDSVLLDFLELDENVYSFQTCQIFQYFRQKGTYDETRLRSVARRFAFSAASPVYLRAEARALLAIYGVATDFDALHKDYPEARNSLDVAEIVCSLSKLEVSRRNAFFASLAGSSWLVERAIEAVRGGLIPVEPADPSQIGRPAPTEPVDSTAAG